MARLCALCGLPVVDELQGTCHPLAPSRDHIVPRSALKHGLIKKPKGRNVQLAHRWCNSTKGSKLHLSKEHRRGMRRRVEYMLRHVLWIQWIVIWQASAQHDHR